MLRGRGLRHLCCDLGRLRGLRTRFVKPDVMSGDVHVGHDDLTVEALVEGELLFDVCVGCVMLRQCFEDAYR